MAGYNPVTKYLLGYVNLKTETKPQRFVRNFITAALLALLIIVIIMTPMILVLYLAGHNHPIAAGTVTLLSVILVIGTVYAWGEN